MADNALKEIVTVTKALCYVRIYVWNFTGVVSEFLMYMHTSAKVFLLIIVRLILIYMVLFQRIAETLDAEIKRWAAGKEGNLRALLSTLQYVCYYLLLPFIFFILPCIVFYIGTESDYIAFCVFFFFCYLYLAWFSCYCLNYTSDILFFFRSFIHAVDDFKANYKMFLEED